MKSDFLIDRPVFSTVISVLIVIVGLIGLTMLPIDQYPDVVPPQVRISASYPGASALAVSQAVATPIEQELNGTPGMMYMESTNTNTGSFTATVTFDSSTDPDLAAVEIQNRVKEAESRLPSEVVQNGISIEKQAASRLLTITLQSSDPKFDEVYLSNYATLNVVDMLRRVPGVGRVQSVGGRYYAMQIWVQPDKLASLGLTVGDLQEALRDQNRESAAGVLGQQPIENVDVTTPITATGRLSSESEFENIVVRASDDGTLIRLKDVARVSLEAQSYNTESGIDGENAAVINIMMLPGANAVEVADNVKATMAEISEGFPDGITYDIPFDMTDYISESIHEVYKTLFEALILVILVVFLSLQSWRATLVPAIAVPISLVGTFGVMLIFGFTLNTMTLLALVLAIGIVVDDAIVVVENVDRIMEEEHLGPKEATKKAMAGIGNALVAMSLVLCAVFVPVSFLPGITGELFRQFSVTIAVSVIISTVVALTLSPVMCATFLRPGDGRGSNFIFRKISSWYSRGNSFYAGAVRTCLHHSRRMFAAFGVVCVGIFVMARLIPQSFLPAEDQGYFTVELELPVGATLERTRAVSERAMDFFMRQDDIENVLSVVGSSPRIGTSQANAQFTVMLKPWKERKVRDIAKIMQTVSDSLSLYPEAKVYTSTPAVIPGLGSSGGIQMALEARGDCTYEALQAAADTLVYYASRCKELSGVSSAMQKDIPQLYFDVDRDKAQLLGVPIADIFSTLKAFTGSVYINDFNMYNRVYRVYLQAEGPYRAHRDNLNLFFVKSANSAMVPVTALGTTSYTTGAGTVKRFNMFNAAMINAEVAQGYSSGQAMDALEQIVRTHLPSNVDIEWSGLSYQEQKEGGKTGVVLALCVLFVFLFLAALYESWSVPVAVLMSLPIAIAGAYFGVLLFGYDSNIYFQIGLVMLVGLVAKNAILIVEFAKENVEKGEDPVQAAADAAKLRFRPIMMTSLAFILGMLPLVMASGPGAASRQNIGTGVFIGMIVAVTAGILFVPFFFVWIYRFKEIARRKMNLRKLAGRLKGKAKSALPVLLLFAGMTGLGSCSTAKYVTRPELGLPESYPDASVMTDSLSLADLEWTEIYGDTLLSRIIEDALEYNKDMEIAAHRIQELQYRFRIENSRRFPSLSATASADNEYNNYDGSSASNDPEIGLKAELNWELDLWGRLSYASREASAEYLASVEARRGIQMSLIAEVARCYFELVSLDEELAVVKATVKTREEGVAKAELRFQSGLTNEIPYQQSIVELAAASSLVPDLERRIAIKESELAFLSGSYPKAMERRSTSLVQLRYRDRLPAGVPSTLLERRPDLREAQLDLRAAEAAVGVANAERFPSFTINLIGGLEDDNFGGLLRSPFYYALGNLASPLFNFGRNKANFKAAVEAYERSRAEYEKAVMSAFKEVYDASVSFNSAIENTNMQSDLLNASLKYYQLASLQYINGVISYLDVLDAQRRYFDAQISHLTAVRDEYLAMVSLYKVLGGGW